MDLAELKELEKLAALHEQAGNDPHSHILTDKDFLLDEELRL